MSGNRVRRAAMEWNVPCSEPTVEAIDARLRSGTEGRTGWMQVLIDHDFPGVGQCPCCGWVATSARRDCPSRVIAKALLDRTPLPAWLAHLAAAVPGSRVRQPAVSREQQRVVEDELPGLFEAPARQPERQR